MHKAATTRRRAVPVALAVFVALALLAAAAYGSPRASKRATAEGTLVVDTSFVVQTIDPQRMFEPTSQIAVKAMYDTLLTFARRQHDAAAMARSLLEGLEGCEDVHVQPSARRPLLRRHAGDLGGRASSRSAASINLKGSPSFLLAGVKVSAPNAYTVVLRSSQRRIRRSSESCRTRRSASSTRSS